jgi:hypothetical protein
VRTSLSAAGAAAFLAWLMDIAIAGVFLALDPNRVTIATDTDWLALAILGPVAGYVVQLSLEQAALYLGLTLLVREMVVRGLWHWTLQQAQAL